MPILNIFPTEKKDGYIYLSFAQNKNNVSAIMPKIDK